MTARELLEGVARGYAPPHPCGPHDLGVDETPCNCLSQDEVLRRLESALQAVLDLHKPTPQYAPYCLEDGFQFPCPTVRAITKALGGP